MRTAERKRTRLLTGERRAQLLTLGLRIFSSRSYDEVSMDDLAREAGISKGLVYHYFPTKRHFYVAALREAARELVQGTEADANERPTERLRIGLDAYLHFVEGHARAYVALMRGGIGSDKQVSAVIEQTRIAFVERVLAAPELSSITPALRLAVRGWIGFVEATALEWISGTSRGIERDELVALWMRMLLAATGLVG